MSSNEKFSIGETTGPEGVPAEELDYDYELCENVAKDLIKYTRSRTVKNEQQFFLTTLGYISGYFESPKHFISGVLIATAGAGKSHVQNTVAELIDDDIMYEATTGSEKSIIYDDSWNESMVANLDELQKPSEDIIEILKSLHGGEDEEFRYKVTGGGEGADRETDEIVKKAIPYWFLYAQYEPDFEMWDRLLKVPIHESSEKNDGVARTHWGHSHINFGDDEKSYMYDFDEGTKALKDHIREMPRNAWVEIPAGEEEYGGHDFYGNIKTIFDIDRSETNRVSKMVANLVRASALVNHKSREKRKIQVENDGVKEAIIADPQDLANIMSCREVLMATTHQLDRKRRGICLAIEEVGGTQNAAPIKHPDDRPGAPKSIMGYLRETNASFIKKSQIIQMLADLEDNGMVEKLEGAGEGGRNLYKFTSWQNLGKFEIDEEFKELFHGTVDPFENSPFIETAREINDDLTPSASDFMSEEEVSSGGSSVDEDGQATLTGDVEDDTVSIDLAPHEEMVYEMLEENLDGEKLTNLDEHDPSTRELLGLVEMGEPDDSVEVDDTILDPAHPVWSHGPEDWVDSTQAAERNIEKALRNLTKEGVFRTSTTKSRGGKPLEMRVTVEDIEE
jgi:DNA-binding PadR family transcriptional regulator